MTWFDLVHYTLVGFGVFFIIVLLYGFFGWLKDLIIKAHETEQREKDQKSSVTQHTHHTEEHHIHHTHHVQYEDGRPVTSTFDERWGGPSGNGSKTLSQSVPMKSIPQQVRTR